MPRRSERPSRRALRSRQSHALRNMGLAFSRTLVSDGVITMLIRSGKLPDSENHSDIEIERAVSVFLLELAGERNMTRVSSVMRERWHGFGE